MCATCAFGLLIQTHSLIVLALIAGKLPAPTGRQTFRTAKARAGRCRSVRTAREAMRSTGKLDRCGYFSAGSLSPELV